MLGGKGTCQFLSSADESGEEGLATQIDACRDRVGALIRGLSDAKGMEENKEALRALVEKIGREDRGRPTRRAIAR